MGKMNIFEKLGFTESKNEKTDQQAQHDDLVQADQVVVESSEEVDVLRQLEQELKAQEQAGELDETTDQFDNKTYTEEQNGDDAFEAHLESHKQAQLSNEQDGELAEYPFAQEDNFELTDTQMEETLNLSDEQPDNTTFDLSDQPNELTRQLEQKKTADVEVGEAPKGKKQGLIKTSDKIEQFLALNNYERPADSPSLATIFSEDGDPLEKTSSLAPQQGNDVEKKLDLMIETYEKNRLLTIEDIYRKAALLKEKKATIFMVDIYAKALPENLPSDIKRDSVLNIMRASDLDINELLNDAYMRIDTLNRTMESVVQTTEKIKQKNRATVDDLESQIKDLKKSTLDRERFQESQNTTLEYEIQRIINIVDFIKTK